jgi:hypothetical protein
VVILAFFAVALITAAAVLIVRSGSSTSKKDPLPSKTQSQTTTADPVESSQGDDTGSVPGREGSALFKSQEPGGDSTEEMFRKLREESEQRRKGPSQGAK